MNCYRVLQDPASIKSGGVRIVSVHRVVGCRKGNKWDGVTLRDPTK